MNKDFEERQKASVKRNAEKIGNCEVFVSIVTPNYIEDPHCAMQLGLAILMDKPIRLIVEEGTKLPENLRKVADRIEFIKGPDDVGLAAQKLMEDSD